MKTITLTLYLLFALSIGSIEAQSLQFPVNSGSDDGGDYSTMADPVVSNATLTELMSITQVADQLTMAANPNPFKDRTMITCTFPEMGKFILEIRNMLGETVKTIEDNVEQKGIQSIEVTSENLKPGIYTAILMFKTSQNVMIKTSRIVFTK